MDNSICLHFINIFFLINGFQALSFFKFDIATNKVNRTRNVDVTMEKKFDEYHVLKGENTFVTSLQNLFPLKKIDLTFSTVFFVVVH